MKNVIPYILLFLIAISGNSGYMYAQIDLPASIIGISKVHCDWVYIDGANLYQDIYFISDNEREINLYLKLFIKKANGDSSIIYSIAAKNFNASKGVNRVLLLI
ncbi:hypothetical protein F0919_00260 [Taibaiella lutea]|uniref:Uncharacterized protein n=1 Tax=Taibaiella lutea TaxID=2608001 RepID=A0A5M6CSL8_9BACT|nr:hypothetical protein [Taibaiella lutea]KAA5536139.1 hypothetical protein F0919_00260 [Taibaiella lutea]